MGNDFLNSANQEDSPCKSGGDCSKFSQMIHSVIDGEIASDDLKFFEEHADECVACLEYYGAEKEFVEEIREKLSRHCCPEKLLLSIKDKINELRD